MGNALSWEAHLISLAHVALDVDADERITKSPAGNQLSLSRAYWYCEKITEFHSKTFFMASGLLPADKRRAIRALYAFCRVSDDLVDQSVDNAFHKLDEWRRSTISSEPDGGNAVILAWDDTRYKYQIPWGYAEQLITGVAKDLQQTRYQTFSELATYCYGVACTVGLMAMHIVGYAGTEAIPYAIRLGVALQLTNILRDVGDDWKMGRVYLPQQELMTFGLSDQDIAVGKVTDQWRNFMRFQIERNRQLYNDSMPGISLLNKDGRFAIRAAAELYEAILIDIEEHDYDVFSRRAWLSQWDKLRLVPGIWWRAKKNTIHH